ncbi:hypothetical protein [Sphingobacterium sp.]
MAKFDALFWEETNTLLFRLFALKERSELKLKMPESSGIFNR